MNSDPQRRPPRRSLSLGDPIVRSVFWQVVILGAIGWCIWWLVSNTMHNLEVRRIASGFAFLHREAGLPIGEALIEYSPENTYLRALFVGVLNTLKVAAIGIVTATVMGTAIGIARLSRNFLLAKLASAYVEVMRDLPLLLQLFFWYAILQALPGPRQALSFGNSVFLSNRGIYFPWIQWTAAHWAVLGAFLAGILGTILLNRRAARLQETTGVRPHLLMPALGLLLGLPAATFLAAGMPWVPDVPALRGFNFQGGVRVTP
ncbi:MAG: ABC transporter permease subunit, partial [Alphaproteobacteria bacterium]|nr:ABC transporter permease subunit [Alphaproteobacteria bacterium]